MPSLLAGKPPGIVRGICRYRIVGDACRTQPLNELGYPARRDRTGHLVVGHPGTHPAQHTADAHGDLAAFLGNRNDMALRFAFEAKARPRVVQQHLLLSIHS